MGTVFQKLFNILKTVFRICFSMLFMRADKSYFCFSAVYGFERTRNKNTEVELNRNVDDAMEEVVQKNQCYYTTKVTWTGDVEP